MNHINYMEYLEKTRHGTALFPIEYYYVDKTHPRYIMTAHWHQKFEIIHILSGSFTIYLNNTKVNLNKDDILFVECGCLHRGEPTDCVYECIVVDLKMLLTKNNSIVEHYILQITNSQVSIKNALIPKECELYKTLTELFVLMRAPKAYYELSVYASLFAMISQIYSNGYTLSSSCTQSNKQVEKVGLILDWINQNFKEEINSKKLSQISNLNFNYLCKIFKNITGQTITQYVNEQRIEHACYDITMKNTSITEAAFGNGFNDLSYFAKIFKRYKGITPREFKILAKTL
ncbi:MAG: helix-turn-helix transcriptional regulator [Clostridia bacterium]|nr:helix-turn-helix transcriptional regulator [Clostridia bacterium]MBQ4131821.1 helix-turn-helix transcriptional regulator [Clostridia bacterium]